MYTTIADCQIIDGLYVPGDNIGNGDAIIATLRNLTTDETRLQIIEHPAVEVWIEPEGTATYKDKREARDEVCLQRFVFPYARLREGVEKRLFGFSKQYDDRRWMASPYIYGADINPVVRLKIDYRSKVSKAIMDFKFGVIDLETSVLGDERILCASYASRQQCSVTIMILEEWYGKHSTSELEAKCKLEWEKFASLLNKKAKAVWDSKPWTLNIVMCPSERDLLINIFRTVHTDKPEFVLAWNSDYDYSYILDRLEFYGISPELVFCHPDVPAKLRYFKYHRDTRPGNQIGHFTDRWHCLDASGYSKWIDAMALYSRLRKAKGRESSYTLDFIASKNIGSGKMSFEAGAGHETMQRKYQVEYCAYNTIDVLTVAIQELVNHDLVSLVELSGISPINDFSHQTVVMTHKWFKYCRENHMVPGSVGSIDMTTKYDVFIGNIGGAVLSPEFMKEIGGKTVEEIDLPTYLYKLCCDLDVTSFYPSLVESFNISKDTKRATILMMDCLPTGNPDTFNAMGDSQKATAALQNAEAMYKFFSRLPSVEENAVALGHEYFNLPSYMEMLQLYRKHKEIA